MQERSPVTSDAGPRCLEAVSVDNRHHCFSAACKVNLFSMRFGWLI